MSVHGIGPHILTNLKERKERKKEKQKKPTNHLTRTSRPATSNCQFWAIWFQDNHSKNIREQSPITQIMHRSGKGRNQLAKRFWIAEQYVTFVNLHKSRGGIRDCCNRNAESQLQWLCQVPGQWLQRGAHVSIKSSPGSLENWEQNRDRCRRMGMWAGPCRLSFHTCLHTVRASVHLSTQALLLVLSSWPPHHAGCLQPNSSCQDCIPNPSGPAVRGYVLNLHSAFFFKHLE